MRRPYRLDLFWRGGEWKYSASYGSQAPARRVGKQSMERLRDVINWRVIDTRTGEDVSA